MDEGLSIEEIDPYHQSSSSGLDGFRHCNRFSILLSSQSIKAKQSNNQGGVVFPNPTSNRPIDRSRTHRLSKQPCLSACIAHRPPPSLCLLQHFSWMDTGPQASAASFFVCCWRRGRGSDDQFSPPQALIGWAPPSIDFGIVCGSGRVSAAAAALSCLDSRSAQSSTATLSRCGGGRQAASLVSLGTRKAAVLAAGATHRVDRSKAASKSSAHCFDRPHNRQTGRQTGQERQQAKSS